MSKMFKRAKFWVPSSKSVATSILIVTSLGKMLLQIWKKGGLPARDWRVHCDQGGLPACDWSVHCQQTGLITCLWWFHGRQTGLITCVWWFRARQGGSITCVPWRRGRQGGLITCVCWFRGRQGGLITCVSWRRGRQGGCWAVRGCARRCTRGSCWRWTRRGEPACFWCCATRASGAPVRNEHFRDIHYKLNLLFTTLYLLFTTKLNLLLRYITGINNKKSFMV